METLLIFGGLIGVFYVIGWIVNTVDERNDLRNKTDSLLQENDFLRDRIAEWEDYADNLTIREEELKNDQNTFNQLMAERVNNFPLLGEVWADLSEIADEERARALIYKRNPALKAAEEVRAIKKEKRELITNLASWKYKAKNYESVYPWLEEELAQDIEDVVAASNEFKVYTENERKDPVTRLISAEDYRKLSRPERNQLALDRYWQRGKKTKWMIGVMYERYVGYLYEKDGWEVEYFGIHKRFEDLGRDLIAKKGDQVHVIQCKNWSSFKTIYENHIFQLFGTTYSLKKEFPDKKVVPVFYTTTHISDTAAEFARLLGIVVRQNKKLEEYPSIKCHNSATKDKIYHLPFDQQYDNLKIKTKTGDFYAKTVAEAESRGFRRAMRWQGNKV